MGMLFSFVPKVSGFPTGCVSQLKSNRWKVGVTFYSKETARGPCFLSAWTANPRNALNHHLEDFDGATWPRARATGVKRETWRLRPLRGGVWISCRVNVDRPESMKIPEVRCPSKTCRAVGQRMK